MRKKGKARVITKPEINRTVKCQIGNVNEKRNIALIYFAFATGFRATEIQRLLIRNVFDENWEVKDIIVLEPTQTKSGQPEEGYFCSKKAQVALIEYIEHRKYLAEFYNKRIEELILNAQQERVKSKLKEIRPVILTRDDPLFVQRKGGHDYKGEAFQKNGIVKLIKQIFAEAGITDRVSSHSCRRTFATNLNDNGADIKSIQHAMRHRDIKMSMRYIENNPFRIKELCKKSIID
jgi:site-specific recombinase XerD